MQDDDRFILRFDVNCGRFVKGIGKAEVAMEYRTCAMALEIASTYEHMDLHLEEVLCSGSNAWLLPM